jgi:NAD(P)-dependent dehydrogenase (short-subunit alcohol dehydrogenase family)
MFVDAATGVAQFAGDFTMASKLSGKVALVTGGSAGIGLGIAKCFAEEGARVFITGRRESELDKAVTAIGSDAISVQGDTSNLDDLDRIYATIKAKAGHIDVLAVNAGYYEFGRFGEITAEHFDRTFNTNVRGLLFTVQKALPLLAEGASVILTGSIASIKGFPSFSVYNASKAAVRSFARSWIADLKGSGIRINVLSPGHVETPGLSNLMTAEQKAEAVALVPLGRIGTPDDLGKAAAFLASDDSAYVTGIELFVDGGVAQI